MSNYNHRRRLVPPGVPPPSSPRNLATSPNGNAGVPPAPQATLSNAERRAMKRVVGGGLKENIDSILEEEMHQQNAPKSPYHPEQISQPETSQPPANSAIKAEPTVKQSSVIGSFIKQIGIKSSALMGGESSSNATEHPPKEIKIKITEPDPHSAKEDPPMLNEQLSPTDGLSPREVHSEDSHSGEDAVSPRGSDNTNSSKELTSPTKTRNTGNKKPLSNSVDLRLPTLKSFFSSSKVKQTKLFFQVFLSEFLIFFVFFPPQRQLRKSRNLSRFFNIWQSRIMYQIQLCKVPTSLHLLFIYLILKFSIRVAI